MKNILGLEKLQFVLSCSFVYRTSQVFAPKVLRKTPEMYLCSRYRAYLFNQMCYIKWEHGRVNTHQFLS
jgi:hypothetical protein